jgi:septal ring factor EnvC (AmiA/AmiB activator)
MAISHVELYEALKPVVGEVAARLMANVIPPAENLATKADVADSTYALKSEIAAFRTEVKDEISTFRTEVKDEIAELGKEILRLDTKIEASGKDTMRWMLGFFIPVWAGTWATVIAVLLKH